MTEQRVVDLDDSFENRNWLRIVALMKEGKTRQEAVDILRGNTGGPIAGHDVAQHGNEGLSNPVESYNKMFSKGFYNLPEHQAAVQNADTDTLPDIIDKVEKLPHGDHPKVQAELDAARVHLTGAKLSTNEDRKRHHLVEARKHVTNGLGIMYTLNALTHDNDDANGSETEPDADDTGVLGGGTTPTSGGSAPAPG